MIIANIKTDIIIIDNETIKRFSFRKLSISKAKKCLTVEDLLNTKVGSKIGSFSINDELYLEYYSLVLNGKDEAFLEDWEDTDDFGDRWQSIIIPDELANSLDLEEDGDTGGFIVPENIKNHIINIFEFDDDENIDIIGVSSWYSMRKAENYGSNHEYTAFIEELRDKL